MDTAATRISRAGIHRVDDPERRIAIAVLQDAVIHVQRGDPEYADWVTSADAKFWCLVAGLPHKLLLQHAQTLTITEGKGQPPCK